MTQTSLEKRQSISLKERGQYVLAFGVIGLMLFVVGFPVFLLIFFGVLAFFVWKIFSPESRTETRKIFEFYLSANEMLREDERRWFGFEIREAIQRGEAILRTMNASPPLVHFALGALYQKIGDHSSALRHLVDAVEAPAADELSIVIPPPELREYVRLLRRIERAPAESPLTSAAVRSLERARKNRGAEMLELSRSQVTANVPQLEAVGEHEAPAEASIEHEAVPTGPEHFEDEATEEKVISYRFADNAHRKKPRKAAEKSERQTISEVLHDIYDKNA